MAYRRLQFKSVCLAALDEGAGRRASGIRAVQAYPIALHDVSKELRPAEAAIVAACRAHFHQVGFEVLPLMVLLRRVSKVTNATAVAVLPTSDRRDLSVRLNF